MSDTSPTLQASTGPVRAERYHHIDGLRGLFSVTVMLFHIFFIFFTPWLPNYRDFGLLFDGTAAVHIFFVLSGFSLIINYMRKLEDGRPDADEGIRRMAAARYFRLAIPCLLASLAMYVVMRLGLNSYASIPADFKQEWWAWAYTDRPLSFFGTLKFSLYDIFFPSAFIPVIRYDGPYLITNLWTMSIEFFGSFLVFIYALTIRDHRYRLLVTCLVTVCLVLASSPYAYFFAGIFIADVCLKLKSAALPRWADVTNILLLVFMFVVGRPNSFAVDVLFCLAFVLAASVGSTSRAFFGSRFFRYLGSLSFALYLVHMPIVVSVQSWIFLHYQTVWPHAVVIAVAGGLSLVLSLVAAHFFAYVDLYSIRVSHQVARLVVGKST